MNSPGFWLNTADFIAPDARRCRDDLIPPAAIAATVQRGDDEIATSMNIPGQRRPPGGVGFTKHLSTFTDYYVKICSTDMGSATHFHRFFA